jgi:DNA adenine methylase
MVAKVAPILKYPGAKWRLAPWIVSHFPEHRGYVEPFCGSAAVFFTKKPARNEVLNDSFGAIVNLFRVLRDTPDELIRLIDLTPWAREEYELSEQHANTGDSIEDARRFLVRCWQAHGTRFARPSGWRNVGPSNEAKTTTLWRQLPTRLAAVVDRLKDAEIECRPAVEVIGRYNTPNCLIYADPPYVMATRNEAYYAHEMTDADHLALLEVLDQHRGFVVLSGYEHSLYDNRLPHWQKVTLTAQAEKGNERTEVLWLNPRASGAKQMHLFEEVACD